jgi:BNR repeat-containing family member/alpha-L-rhamnosidase
MKSPLVASAYLAGWIASVLPMWAELDPATFQNPPPDARPMTWMHMMNNNASKEGLTKHLQGLADAGVGGVLTFSAKKEVANGNVPFSSVEWREIEVHGANGRCKATLPAGIWRIVQSGYTSTVASHPPATAAESGSLSSQSLMRVSTVGDNGMPKNIVPKGSEWNFGPGSLWTHRGWQYAAYWDEACQVSVARRRLPQGEWSVASLPGYQRTANINRGVAGPISRGFGDSHEKVSMGISPDGVIHLAFDHHVSTLHYRTSILAVANDPAAHPWTADLFGPVRDNLGGPRIEAVTYPGFSSDGKSFVLYLRLNGGSGSADSHFFKSLKFEWRNFLRRRRQC